MRSDLAIRRHWALVCCAFSFCWHAAVEHLDLGQPPEIVGDPEGDDPVEARSAGRGKIRSTLTWPAALRQVRAWLTPWIWLRRWWRAWSSAPPPPELHALLDALAHGYPLPFYDSS